MLSSTTMKIYCPILILFSFCISAWSQTPYHWKLTDDEGLPDMEIYGLYQDNRGYMWIATDAGLCRYDGKNITTYNHPLQKSTSAASIQEDSKGNIWYKNFSGQLFFVDINDTVHLFEIPDSIKLNAYFEYSFTKNQLNIASYSYIYHHPFEEEHWLIDTVKNSYQSRCSVGIPNYHQVNDSLLIYIDCANEVWVQKEKVLSSNGFIPDTMQNQTMLHALDKDTVLLVLGNKIYIDHIDHITKLREKALVFSKKDIFRVYPYKDKVLISTQEGIFILRKNNSSNSWKVQDKLSIKDPISAVCIDRSGSFWLGTLGNGVIIIPSLKMHYLDAKNSDLPNSPINALTKTNKEELFIGMKGYISKLNTQTLELTNYPIISNYPIINILYDEKRNQILLNSKRSYTLSLSPEAKIQPCCIELAHHAILYKEDQLISGGLIALSTYNLVHKPGFYEAPNHVFEGKVNYHFYQKTDDCKEGFYEGFINSNSQRISSNSQRITALWSDLTDTSRFWTGLNGNLFYWQNMVPHTVLSNTGSPIIPVGITQTKDSIIWVATFNQGLYGIKNEQEVYHFTTADGLPSNNCKTITSDSTTIWIGTNKGIIKLHPKTRKVDLYNQLDGLVSDNIDNIVILNQKIWATTTKGLISFDVNTPSINTTPPLININKWVVNDSSYALKSTVSLFYDQNNIEFTFQALTLKSRNNYTYEYRLLGIDSLWIQQASSTNFARFPNLNPGDYTFEVRARNEDGILSKTSQQISFSIQPPVWETWWFRSIIGLIILTFIIFIVRFRYQFLQRKQATQNLITQLKMQALQAQMNPHFIFNAMSTIQSFWMYKDAKTALIYHAKFAKLMRLIFNYSNEKSIPIKEEIDFLKLYIDLEKIRLKHTINITFEVDAIFEEEDLHIPPLLIQPIVENSFKHGFLHKEADGQLFIKLQKEAHYIKCIIEDNGVGRATAASYNSWKDNTTNKKSSSFVTQDRLNMLNHTEGAFPKKIVYKITDLKDAQNKALGTRTELWIPIFNNFFSNFN